MRGEVTLYNPQGIELESHQYGNPIERRDIINSWTKELSAEGYYIQIRPKANGDIRLERQTIRGRLLIEQLKKAS